MTATRVLVVAGPELVADLALLRRLTETECDLLSVPGRFVTVPDGDALWDALGQAGPGCAIVALPGPDADARRALCRPGSHAARTVWCDLAATGPVEVAAGSAHIAGRGVWGLAWAIRHAVHRLRHPARRIPYGQAAEQWGELRLPPGHDGRPLPVAVLLHGGFWRSVWGADLMDALAIDLADRGYAAWNLEYRRPDRHGWRATTADIADGAAALGTLGPALDPDRIAVIGHSAGGQLALRVAADQSGNRGKNRGKNLGGIALAVSLAGVLDLAEGDRRRIGAGAVAQALGGTREEVPEVYAAADPSARLPLGVPQLVVQGRDDDLDLIDFNRRHVAAAREAGDEVVFLEQPGDHFSVIDPAAEIWHATVAEMDRRLHV
ncbi:alpha/beta hydrolase [Planotetraspora sp. A-T 1434]|uniref:alpha/beta hydrolase family protein n=1 Tax=Planotetraspora sp. A-T 1434 TaxID=2979219 RepID=UPI0021BFDEB8|nr:alpha/beta hydrolase [Planotetraspora sp. A-T 1434]MCT9930755.1 alpha/beta hydrolase [Planotetraspora sp. A-T 1434]